MHLHSLAAPAFVTRISEIYSKHRHTRIPAALTSSNFNASNINVTVHRAPAGFECFAHQCPFSKPRRVLIDEQEASTEVGQTNLTSIDEDGSAAVASVTVEQGEGGGELKARGEEPWWRCASYKSKRRRLARTEESSKEEVYSRLRRQLQVGRGDEEEMKEQFLARQARKIERAQSGKKTGRDHTDRSSSSSSSSSDSVSDSGSDSGSGSSTNSEKGRTRDIDGRSSSRNSGGRSSTGRGGRVRTKGTRNATRPHVHQAKRPSPSDDFLYGAHSIRNFEGLPPLPPPPPPRPPLPPPEAEGSLLAESNHQAAGGFRVPKDPSAGIKPLQGDMCH